VPGDPSAFLPPPPILDVCVSRPPTLLSRPKLIGLRIGRPELFILCPAINQFLRRPNRGRKDRAATRAAKRRTLFGVRVLEQREGRREGRANRKAARERGTRRQLSLGKLVNLERSSSDALRRHLISSFRPIMRKMRERRKINDAMVLSTREQVPLVLLPLQLLSLSLSLSLSLLRILLFVIVLKSSRKADSTHGPYMVCVSCACVMRM